MKLFVLAALSIALVAGEAEKAATQTATPAAASSAFPWTRSTNLLQASTANAPATPAAPAKPFFDPFFFGMYYPFMWMWYMPWMWMSWTMPFMWMWW